MRAMRALRACCIANSDPAGASSESDDGKVCAQPDDLRRDAAPIPTMMVWHPKSQADRLLRKGSQPPCYRPAVRP